MKQAILLCLLAVTVSAGNLEGPWRVTEGDFKNWMAEGGEEIHRTDDFPTLRLKIAKRVAAWCAEQLKNVSTIYNALTWISRVAGFGTTSLADDLENLSKSETTASFVKNMKATAEKYAASVAKGRTVGSTPDEYKPMGPESYPYWGFIPLVKGHLMGDGQAVTWENRGCRHNSAVSHLNSNKTEMTITLTAEWCDELLPGDFYALATVDGWIFVKLSHTEKQHNITWKVNASEAVQYDVEKKGVRVFAFIHDEAQLIIDVTETVELFLQPEAGKYPDYPTDEAMHRNIRFLTDYSMLKPVMTARPTRNITDLDPSLIQSGDFIGVIRLDGLDPMLGWAMGSSTGHTTVAMRDEKGDLWVCESTTNSSYWPTNGVQKTPWATWIQQAKAAGYNAVWAPLDPNVRAKLNQTNMWDFFASVEGLQYGYHTLLWGWLDTEQNNYPCLPPDFKVCLVWEHIEVLFSLADILVPEVGQLLFMEAWNKRLGTTGLKPAEMYMYSETKLNMPARKIPTIPEQDSWRYNTTRNGVPTVGRSMVCCVFVCHMWKAGGMFGDKDVNCGELTNHDDYDMAIFNKALMNDGRPEVCQKLDPNNENCQLVGPYTLNYNNYNQAPIYERMCENCSSWKPGVGPDYWPAGKQDGTC